LPEVFLKQILKSLIGLVYSIFCSNYENPRELQLVGHSIAEAQLLRAQSLAVYPCSNASKFAQIEDSMD
jgi:hypothetical protein